MLKESMNILANTKGGTDGLTERRLKRIEIVLVQERINLRELIPHIGPLPIVIPLKLFLERVGFPADDISSRVAWKFRGGVKAQNHVGSAGVGFILSLCEMRIA